MDTVCGPFYKLEREFCRRMAAKPPLDPALVITPSRRLAERLQLALADANGFAGGTAFHTFYSLAELLAAQSSGDEGKELPSLAGPRLEKFVLKNILETQSRFGVARPTNGLVSGVRAAIRDMADARVLPATVSTHLAENAFAPEDSGRVAWAAELALAFENGCGALGLLTHTKLLEKAAFGAAASEYLASQKEIIFYGFYDLTGIQLELFEAVHKNHSVTLYYPYINHPAYKFATRFFETNVLGNSRDTVYLEPEHDFRAVGGALDALFSAGKAAKPNSLSVASVSGSADEVWRAAREIVYLVERLGYRYGDIAVIARTLAPYTMEIGSVFRENLIPFETSANGKLAGHPLGRLCLSLLTLEQEDFSAGQILGILGSPYCSAGKITLEWERVIRASGFTGGWEQWRSLALAGDGAMRASAPVFSGWLGGLRDGLIALRRAGSWKELAAGASAFLRAHIDVAALDEAERGVFGEVENVINGAADYDAVRPAAEGEFLRETAEALLAAETEVPGQSQAGVKVLDVMAARGQSFRAVVLLGLNEKMFPRLVREDPILRDAARRVMRDAEGFWINPKLEGYEEEKMLFHMTLACAGERILCVYQRSDEHGDVVVPSIYLYELARACGFAPDDREYAEYVPRQQTEKLAAAGYEGLSKRELRLKISLQHGCAPQLYAAAGLSSERFDGLKNAASAIGGWGGAGAYDGITGEKSKPGVREGALSPTALEQLSRCPMQYFFDRVLRLGAETEPLSCDSLPPKLAGKLAHEILKDVYENITAADRWGDAPAALLTLRDRFERLAPAGHSARLGVYPVVWQAEREALLEKLEALVAEDMSKSEGFIPEFFEQEVDGVLTATGAQPWRGRIDRIDKNSSGGLYRIVDYKNKRRGGSDKLDKLVLEGELLQPFIYPELAAQSLARELAGCKFAGSFFMALSDGETLTGKKRTQVFSAESRAELRGRIEETINFLLALIKEGNFFLRPRQGEGGWCGYCRFGAACRKNHPPSVLRAANSPECRRRESLAGR